MIRFKKCQFSRKKKKFIKKRVLDFLKEEKITNHIESILLDWTPQEKTNTFGGYYGGFISMYSNNQIYINLTVFYELTNLLDIKQVLWAIIHELVHVKQIIKKEIIISKDAETLLWKNKIYEKLNFRGEIFCEIYKQSPKEATLYHIKEIPWEYECYLKSDLFVNQKSFDHNKLNKEEYLAK